jgi:CHASE3 domain sensor protein
MLTFSRKLYLGFSVVIALLALVGSTAYFALSNAAGSVEDAAAAEELSGQSAVNDGAFYAGELVVV